MQTLLDLPFSLSPAPMPGPIAALSAAGDALIAEFEAERGPERIGGFRGTDGRVAWSALSQVRAEVGECGTRFCEWGCGLGLVTCLAEKLGWQATGLDIEPRLVASANGFAADQSCAARFHVASYKPAGMAERAVDPSALDTGCGFGLFDFDVIFAYTWPAEVEAVTQFVADHARAGTLFLRYRGGADFKVFRVIER